MNICIFLKCLIRKAYGFLIITVINSYYPILFKYTILCYKGQKKVHEMWTYLDGLYTVPVNHTSPVFLSLIINIYGLSNVKSISSIGTSNE